MIVHNVDSHSINVLHTNYNRMKVDDFPQMCVHDVSKRHFCCCSKFEFMSVGNVIINNFSSFSC